MKRTIRIVAATRRGKSAFRIPAAILLACCALVLFCGSVAAAQDQQPAAPAGQNQQQTAAYLACQGDATHAGSAFRGQGDHLHLSAGGSRGLRRS